jgi:hypothetical protein
LLVLAAYKFAVVFGEWEEIEELWVGTLPEFAFEIWLFAVPTYHLARLLYHKMSNTGNRAR